MTVSQDKQDISRPSLFIGIDPGVNPAIAILAAHNGVLIAGSSGQLKKPINKTDPLTATKYVFKAVLGQVIDMQMRLSVGGPRELHAWARGPADLHFLIEDVHKSVRPGQSVSSAVDLTGAFYTCLAAAGFIQTAAAEDKVSSSISLFPPKVWRAYFAMNHVDISGVNTKKISVDTANQVKRACIPITEQSINEGRLDSLLDLAEQTREETQKGLADSPLFKNAEHNEADAFLLATMAFWRQTRPDDKFFTPLASEMTAQ